MSGSKRLQQTENRSACSFGAYVRAALLSYPVAYRSRGIDTDGARAGADLSTIDARYRVRGLGCFEGRRSSARGEITVHAAARRASTAPAVPRHNGTGDACVALTNSRTVRRLALSDETRPRRHLTQYVRRANGSGKRKSRHGRVRCANGYRKSLRETRALFRRHACDRGGFFMFLVLESLGRLRRTREPPRLRALRVTRSAASGDASADPVACAHPRRHLCFQRLRINARGFDRRERAGGRRGRTRSANRCEFTVIPSWLPEKRM